ncbi:MAG: branched-chain amino acid ABC transporter permease [Acetobacteraceae bacterium]|nr:branched-chain amino acid ABC transporter permease [Acetobacteraceae bacterium]
MALAAEAVRTAPQRSDRWAEWIAAHPVRSVLVILLLIMPVLANDFFLVQVFGWSLILGMIALSLMFLAGYGGMVSLLQMTVAGIGAYLVAILGASGIQNVSLFWPWWAAVPIAILVATLFGTLCGALAVRTAGIYTIMITLAIASAFFYFTRQNYGIFNGFTGFNLVRAPVFLGVDWRSPVAFYYLALALASLAYFAVVYVSRSPFGLALQGTRDNARRMAALGHNVVAVRVAAYAFASLIAGVAGVLLVWLNAQVSPGTAGVGPVIDILVIAVVGGLGNPIGAFVGALIYVLLRTFAIDVLVAIGLGAERFQSLIGLGFLVVVLLSPDGVVGLYARWRGRRPRP